MRGRLATKDPGEDYRGSGLVATLSLALVPSLFKELANLLIHCVQVFVDVVAPHVQICELDRNMEAVVELEPVYDVLVWLPVAPVATDRLEQLACIKRHARSLL